MFGLGGAEGFCLKRSLSGPCQVAGNRPSKPSGRLWNEWRAGRVGLQRSDGNRGPNWVGKMIDDPGSASE